MVSSVTTVMQSIVAWTHHPNKSNSATANSCPVVHVLTVWVQRIAPVWLILRRIASKYKDSKHHQVHRLRFSEAVKRGNIPSSIIRQALLFHLWNPISAACSISELVLNRRLPRLLSVSVKSYFNNLLMRLQSHNVNSCMMITPTVVQIFMAQNCKITPLVIVIWKIQY
jgi:hypothetical protein